MVGLSSLAGCVTPLFGDEEETRPTSVEEVQLKVAPSANVVNPRTVIPSDDLISTFYLRNRQQIRVNRPGQNFIGDFTSGLYSTRHDVEFDTTAEQTLWMSETGLARINASEGWSVKLLPEAPHTEYDSDGEARDNNEYVEQSIDAGSDILACAPYGGAMYEYTDDQAKRVASETGESAWVCLGYNRGGGALDRWFIDQTVVHPASYPRLGELVGYDGDTDEDVYYEYDQRYDYGVLFTGTDEPGVTVGGLVPDTRKQRIRDEIRSQLARAGGSAVSVRISRTGPLSGTDTKSIANRVSDDGRYGIEIAQNQAVLDSYWSNVADGVVQAFSDD
jgi:hypothetical protein